MDNILALPALKGYIGEWNYYVTVMKFKDIAQRIKFAQEIYHTDTLNQLLQRDVLPHRAKDIAHYILSNKQRFFNAITVGVFGGHPQWIELSVTKHLNSQLPEVPLKDEGILGYLRLSGNELLFPVDGQHRVAGIKALYNSNDERVADITNEEIPVIFIGHDRTPQGIRRIRRLFSTLNRYAKPVSLKDIIALDEDDIVAISTRELIEKHVLFNRNNIALNIGTAINPNDTTSFTNIVTLYKCNDLILQTFYDFKTTLGWNKHKASRPGEDEIKKASDYLSDFWTKFSEFNPTIKRYSGQKGNLMTTEYRNRDGGYYYFRPVGLLIYCRCFNTLLKNGFTIKKAFQALAKIPPQLTSKPWNGIIWEPASKRMIVRDVNQKVAYRMVLYMIGFDLTQIKQNQNKLLEDYASILNKEISTVKLPKKVAR